MVSARWEDIRFVFEMAVSEEEQRWPSLLADACGADTRLAEEVLQLLIADREARTFLEVPAFDTGSFSEANLGVSFELHEVLCGRFEILGLIGEGGMGQVYEALDLELQETVAIKTIRREIVELPGSLERFKRELFTTRMVTHPNVCRTFDLESHSSLHGKAPQTVTFLTMELLRGQTLATRLRERGPLDTEEVRLMAKQIGSALQAAHQVGIIHCDLKPANVFLTRTGLGPRAVVTDFGIARLVQQTQDAATHAEAPQQAKLLSAMAGTPMYMAPEQAENGVCTPRSDLYSFGLVLYEALTGELPSDTENGLGDLEAIMHAHRTVPEEAQQAANPMWTALLAGCLQRDPEKRFSQFSKVLELLENQAGNAELPPGWMDWRRGRAWIVVGSVVGILIVALMLGQTLKLDSSRPARTPSVAVLSFTNSLNDPALQDLTNTIPVDLTTELAQVTGLRVSSHSLVSNSDKAESFGAVGRRLNIDTLLNGSIERAGDGLVEKVELIDAHTGSQLWSRSYERPQAEFRMLQQNIAEEVAFRLRYRTQLDTSNMTPVHTMPPVAKAAYEEGLRAAAEHTHAGWEKAVISFQQAIDADPQSAASYAALANTYILMANNYNRPEAPFSLMSNAEAAARRALQLDSASAAAYYSLALVELLRDYDWDAAEESFKRATELDPGYLPAHSSYAALLLTGQGRFAEARAQFSYADRGPDKKISTEIGEVLGAYYARQYQASLQQAQKIHERAPENEVITESIALNYIAEAKPEEALALLSDPSRAKGDEEVSRNFIRGIAYAKQGKKGEAINVLRQMENSTQRGMEPNLQLASLAAAVGKYKKAMTYLDRSFTRRQTSLLFIAVDPLMDPLRSDPHFHELLKQMHLK